MLMSVGVCLPKFTKKQGVRRMVDESEDEKSPRQQQRGVREEKGKEEGGDLDGNGT